IFAMCLHVALSVIVLYGLAARKPIWFWLAVLWHFIVDAVAVYVGQQVSLLAVEGIVAIFAMISVGIAIWFKPKFADALNAVAQSQAGETVTG
ncbi:MAG TPA: YhfC family glutamic-type intramembrane protease, partial [Acidobacteriota bacterium]|nr:YhfC family glutamic-type intramembrane protease [Acidobacteriota bacterium]